MILSGTISTKATRENIAAVLEILEAVSAEIERVSRTLPEKVLAAPLGDDERSPIQVLAHLINCEALMSEAIYLTLLLDEPLLHKIHPERDWGKLLQPEQFAFGELLAYFTFRRKLLMRVLRSLSDSQWERVVREENKKRKESVYWLARTIALHEREHLEDLERKLR